MHRLRSARQSQGLFFQGLLIQSTAADLAVFDINNMPAVQLAQLNRQIDKLIWHFTRPQDFIKALHELLEFYSNRGVYRPGRMIQPARQINTYYTSSIIIREIEKELKRQTIENPDAAMTLADALWHENFTELSTLSSFMIGLLPVTPPDAV